MYLCPTQFLDRHVCSRSFVLQQQRKIISAPLCPKIPKAQNAILYPEHQASNSTPPESTQDGGPRNKKAHQTIEAVGRAL
jgi:hypothetical protein